MPVIKLRDLLAGRDLQEYIRSTPTAAGQIQLFSDEQRDGALYIQVSSSDSTNAADETGRGDGSRGSLLTDAVGSYSMTDGRSAAAMANILANAVHTVLASTDVASRLSSCDGSSTGLEDLGAGDAAACSIETMRQRNVEIPWGLHCIDLTAGIGGNTVACGRRFDSVLAFEVDAVRADLLRKNVAAAALEGTVTVKCADSLAALPKLADSWEPVQLCTRGAIAAILDPPWGGIHYKRRRLDNAETDSIAGDEGLSLSGVPLSAVVSLVAEHLAGVLPVVLGVKLPLTFDVTAWKARLQSAGESRRQHTTSLLSIKKLGRQLFVVLHLACCDPTQGTE